jgi:pimeloyl-ACP methyl ester carboxylesterase
MSAPVTSETRRPSSEQGDQRVLGRRAEPAGHQQRTELVAVQRDGVGLVIHPQTADVCGRGVIQEFLFDPRIAAVIAVCPLTDGLAMWLEPAPPGTVLRMLTRALRETLTRRPVTIPVAGKPGDCAGTTAPEALPGFEHVTAGRPWRNEISTSWLLPLAAFRPVTPVPKIAAPVLYQIAQHDGMLPAGAIGKAIPRTPRAEVRRYPMDHFGPFSPEHPPAVAAHASDFLRTHGS